tara:strand:+ start:227 stop:394 length:168 start_codon:yes stop_codon:yes gene_type:complete
MSETNEFGHLLEWIDGDGDLMVIKEGSNPEHPIYVKKNPKPVKKAKKSSKKAKKE